LNRLKMKAD